MAFLVSKSQLIVFQINLVDEFVDFLHAYGAKMSACFVYIHDGGIVVKSGLVILLARKRANFTKDICRYSGFVVFQHIYK